MDKKPFFFFFLIVIKIPLSPEFFHDFLEKINNENRILAIVITIYTGQTFYTMMVQFAALRLGLFIATWVTRTKSQADRRTRAPGPLHKHIRIDAAVEQ